MNSDKSSIVRDLINALLKRYKTLTEIEDRFGISRQNLANWRKGSDEHQRLFDFIAAAQKDLELTDEQAYRKVMRGRKKLKPKKKQPHLLTTQAAEG